MLSMYFVDDHHKGNYGELCEKWPQASPGAKYGANTEYQVAVYITALPMIFEKVRDYVEDFDTPLDWISWYLNWEYYKSGDPLDESDEDFVSEPPYDLTSSMKNLGRLALNLWNSSNEFNLMDAMGSFDDSNLNVMLCAIYTRNGAFKNKFF